MLDIARLLWSARRSGPSGIDRVELNYAQHFLRTDALRPGYAVVHVMGWVFGLSPKVARRFIDGIAARWAGARPSGHGRPVSALQVYAQLLSGPWMPGFELRRRLKKYGQAPIFVVVSHHHLSIEGTIRRIRRFFGARCVCLLHDLIPIEYPEFVKPNRELRHRRATRTISRCVDAVIVNSQTTADGFRAYLTREFGPEAHRPGIHVALIGVRGLPLSSDPSPLPEGPDSVPYFVVLGTIEPKKNHLLLLNLWCRFATTRVRPPRLHVIGARGWENEQVIDILERSPRVRGLVEEHNRLDDAGVAALLTHARALLVPSFVEGFGMPLAEALASGVPVICSDIAAFREVGRDVPEYVDPLDLPGWSDIILEYCDPHSERRAAQLRRLQGWPVPVWPDHFAVVESVLDQVAARPREFP